MSEDRLINDEDRSVFDSALFRLGDEARAAIIEDQLTPRDDEEKSLVMMTLYRHRYGHNLRRGKSDNLNECRYVAVINDLCSHETFPQLWQRTLPRTQDEVKICNTVLNVGRFGSRDLSGYLFARVVQDIVKHKMSPSMIVERIEAGFYWADVAESDQA